MSFRTTLHCAVVGNPIAHSRSPEIHHAFAKQCGLKVQYERMLADHNDFADHVRAFFAQGGKGLNVTVPFKEKAFALATQHSDQAQLAGAANTLWMQDGQLHACNTDGVGLVSDLTRLGFDPANKRVLLIGAGGAAKGVLLPLLNAGVAQLRIINRTAAKAEALVEQMTQHQANYASRLDAGDLQHTAGQWDIVINATSSSLTQQSPIAQAIAFTAHSLAYDMVYGPKPTLFMDACSGYGASQCADGLGMLVAQAAQSFQIWHGVLPDTAPVLNDLRQQITL